MNILKKSGTLMLSLIAVLVILYASACLYFYFNQRKMIYYPTPEVSVPGVAHITLDTGVVRIKVWTLNTGRQKALIYFGGNAENVAYNMDDFRVMFPDYTVYLVNYRGYGGSSGSPSEAGFYSDALLAYDYFSKRHSTVSVMGRSVGSAVATYLASQRKVERLLLVTPFDSAVNIGKRLYPYLPIGLIMQERLDSAGRAARITAPTLIVTAADDEIIPKGSTRNLEAAFTGGNAVTVPLSGVGHNSVQQHPEYKRTVAAFMR
jgi:pimeloyl-ACP methyl ester carboxylesterase